MKYAVSPQCQTTTAMLTHSGRDKIAANLLTGFISCNTNSEYALAPNRLQVIIWINDDLVYWYIYALNGLDELTYSV